MYDYLVIGAGLFGAVFAHEMTSVGKKCLVVEKRNHVGGNIYTEKIEGINVHTYGPHIFHTSNKKVWDYVNQFAEFNHFINSPIAVYKNGMYNLPFNMNTFNKLWGVITPEEAKAKIAEQIAQSGIKKPRNLEEKAISTVGQEIYEKLIKGYTSKQWRRPCSELPSFIIERIPVRFTYDNNYYDVQYQGIPIGGYTKIVEKLLQGSDVILNKDYFMDKEELDAKAKKIVFTGMIDAYFGYCFGELEYRSLRFETEILNINNYQGNAVINYTEFEIPYTRVIEHKHFENGPQKKTVITREYPKLWKPTDEPYYPINDQKNNMLYQQYRDMADDERQVIFGGRLGMYQYFDMGQVICEALKAAGKELSVDAPASVSIDAGIQ